jgi:CBS domain-containing protein
MEDTGKPTDPRHQLRVRTRETLEPGGTVIAGETVHCPRREGSATVEECLVCPVCSGLESDAEGRYIVCHYQDEATGQPPLRRRRRRPTDGDRTPLSAVMSADIVCVSPDLPIEQLVALLVDRGFGGVPVVDPHGKPIGVVSKSDLIAGAHTGLVRDIMMPIAFTMPESASLSHAAALMAYENIHRVPVVAADGTVVGIVSSMDIVRWVAEQDGYVVGRTRET